MSENQKENTGAKDRFAQTEEEAEARFEKYKSKDPFPSIKPSLLNSADIYDYVAKTGMIFPFYQDKLKSASYEVNLLGKVIYWDDKGERQDFELKEGDEFTLEKNSIAFVTPEPTFRLPDYIAIRFNLKITHVHRGILLGTGPLVDPGYEGKLLIPLHNLTNNDYKFKGGKALIWVEFTKVSENKRWFHKTGEPERFGEYVPFPDRKNKQEPEYFLTKASPHRSIQSSIPQAISETERSAKDAASLVKKLTGIGIISLVVVIIGLVTAFWQMLSLVEDSTSYVTNAKEIVQQQIKIQEKEINNLKAEIEAINNKLNNITEPSAKIDKKATSSGSTEPKDSESNK